MLSPLEMRIVLHAYTVGPGTCPDYDRCTSELRASIANKLVDQLAVLDYDPAGPGFFLTAKGRAWVQRALSTPMPVQTWSFPAA